ncbi:MAG: amidohydrolase [Planctomycetia bacterium]|nr:amidohydrolase [Planctomycetia bacterium]
MVVRERGLLRRLVFVLGTLGDVVAARAVDLIIAGGTIVTLDERRPQAEALAVRDGRIVAVGSREEVLPLAAPATQMLDLDGRTLVPGFIDAHGHAYSCGTQSLAANLRAAPDGDVTDIASLQATLCRWAASQLAERRHPDRNDLDAVSVEVPVTVIHQSGHLAAANSLALARAGIDAATPDPPGGAIRRRPGSQDPDGVLEGAAIQLLTAAQPAEHVPAGAIARAAQEIYLQNGFTTAQEGKSRPAVDAAWSELAERGELLMDVVSYPSATQGQQAMESPFVGRTYRNHFRIGGVKVTLDGSPQGRTAWLTQPYYRVPAGRSVDYAGYPALKEERVFAIVDEAFARGWQLLAHVNGDAAVDQLIAAVRAAERRHGRGDRRTVAIHAQTVRDDQLAAFVELDIVPSFFTLHTFYWGDWHRHTVLGPERGRNISPTGWALRRGLPFTVHHDAPVVPADGIRVLAATVNRVARGSGDVVGPEHCVPPLTALKALTLWAARQYFEETEKGSIEVGKLADFAVLSANPLAVDPRHLRGIRVEETIKEGRSVYRRQPGDAGAHPAGQPPQ